MVIYETPDVTDCNKVLCYPIKIYLYQIANGVYLTQKVAVQGKCLALIEPNIKVILYIFKAME